MAAAVRRRRRRETQANDTFDRLIWPLSTFIVGILTIGLGRLFFSHVPWWVGLAFVGWVFFASSRRRSSAHVAVWPFYLTLVIGVIVMLAFVGMMALGIWSLAS